MFNDLAEKLREEGVLDTDKAKATQLCQVLNLWDLVKHTEEFQPAPEFWKAHIFYHYGDTACRRIEK